MSEIIRAKGITNQTAGEDLDLDPGADNVVTTLQDDKSHTIKDSLGNTIFTITPLSFGAVAVSLTGTAAKNIAIFSAAANTALGAIAGLTVDEASGSPAGNFRLFEGEIQMISEEDGSGHTKDSMVRSGNATNDSGDVGMIAGTAGGTKGNALIDAANASLDAAGDFVNDGVVTATGAVTGLNLSGTNTGDEVQATESVLGIAELATQAEVTTGTDDLRIVTPLKLATGVYTKSQVDILVDATMKAPEAYDPTITGNYPITYGGNAVEAGDSYRITAAGTMGGITVNIEDLLIALVDTPAQVDASWMVAESNRDQATETVKGVAELATQAETDAGVDDLRIVTPLKFETSSQLAARVVGPASATDHAIARYDLATGKLIQDSLGLIDDAGNISATNLSGTNTGDEAAAAEGTAGIAELATQAETDAGTDNARIVTPLKLRTTPEFRNYNAQVATPYLMTASDDVVTMNVAGASVVNLPTAVGLFEKVYYIKRLSALGPNTVTVTPNGIETIDEAGSFALTTTNASVTIISDNANWLIL